MNYEEEERRRLQEQMRITEAMHGLQPGSLDPGKTAENPGKQGVSEPEPKTVEVRYVEKKQNPLMLLVNGVITVFIVVWLVTWLTSAFGGADSTVPTPLPSESQSSISKTAVDGQLSFTVTSLTCGLPQVGEPGSEVQAKGQFCFAEFNITNTGAEAAVYTDDNQYLIDATGRKYSADGPASYSVYDTTSMQLNPGLSADVVAIYDIPADAVPVAIEVHDSGLSMGALAAIP